MKQRNTSKKSPKAEEDKRKTFEGLALQYMDSLYRTALRMLSSQKDAEDMVQDAYLKAYGAFDTFEPGSNFKAWLFRILVNNIINHYRRREMESSQVSFNDVEPFYKAEPAVAEDEPAPGGIGELLDDDVKSAMDTLPPDYRAVAMLSFVEEFSYKDIAKIMHIPIGTVMSRLFRARKILHRKLASYAKREGYKVGNN